MVAQRSAVGRAELARALAAGEVHLDEVARLLGYEGSARRPPPPHRLQLPEPAPDALPLTVTELDAPPRFYRVTALRYADPDPKPPSERERIRLELTNLSGKRAHSEPLCPWPKLWSRVRPALAQSITGHEVDTPRVVELLARGRRLERIPRRRRQRLPRPVRVVVERSEHLVPFWSDQDQVFAHLRRTLGEHAVEFEWLWSPPSLTSSQRAETTIPIERPVDAVVILSDLGVHAGYLAALRWQVYAKRLAAKGTRLVALVPAPVAHFPRAGFAAVEVLPWEAAGPPGTPAYEPSAPSAAERVLGLLGASVSIEPGLLRAVRRLLPAASAATEAEVWQHRDVLGGGIHGIWIHPDRQAHYREAFVKEPAEIQRAVVELVRRFRQGTREEVWHEEVLTLAALTRDSERGPAVSPEDEQRTHRVLSALAHTVQGDAEGQAAPEGIVPFFDRFVERSQALLGAERARAATAPHLGPAASRRPGRDCRAGPDSRRRRRRGR